MKRKEPLGHYYEVVLQDRPCWLYFDLEYSRETNPKLDTIVAMAAFETVLADFCVQRLGLAVDSTSVLVLDSTSAEKFSKHVLVKRLVGGERDNGNTTSLAFANNAQAGLFVSQLVAFARDRQDSIARLLFARPPGRRGSDCDEVETCIIDESVYSRNRCFRLLFQSKFGKSRSLEMEDRNAAYFSGSKPHPCLALLASMVTFVPADVCYFRHTIIPPSYDRAKDVYRGSQARGAGVARSSGGFRSSLMQYLARRWDEVRLAHEKSDGGFGSTAIQSVRTMDDRYQTVTLANNRFCLRKGASHVSNSVYLVVDKLLARFHQKCTDWDCNGFRSVKFDLPPGLLFPSSQKEVPGMQDGTGRIRGGDMLEPARRELVASTRECTSHMQDRDGS
jgi:hypothetical protein